MRRLASYIRPLAATWIALGSTTAGATLLVSADVLPVDDAFRWEITIENQGPDDVAIVSLFGAPLGDPLIDASLATPPGFFASYDDGLGIVDFLEDTALFAVGQALAGFVFLSEVGVEPGAFARFEALTVNGDPEAGDVSVRLVPEPHTALLVVLGAAALAARPRREGR
jgi:hypothetical protein